MIASTLSVGGDYRLSCTRVGLAQKTRVCPEGPAQRRANSELEQRLSPVDSVAYWQEISRSAISCWKASTAAWPVTRSPFSASGSEGWSLTIHPSP